MRILAPVLLAVGLLCARAAIVHAGQARAQFHASLRIAPALVERDLQRAKGAAAKEPSIGGTPGRKSAHSSRSTRRPDVLPRAGGSGLCRKVYIFRRRFRWRCG